MTLNTLPAVGAVASPTLAKSRPATRARLAYIDNLRNLLVVLVVLHHRAVTYGAEGSWYYYEGRADIITTTLLTLFVVVNQSFFMGFYFLLAAYFVPHSLERKGCPRFLTERLLRLGAPLVLQLLVLGPLLSYGLAVAVWGFDGSLWAYIGDYLDEYAGLDTGALWFVEALLLFSAVYALWWRLAGPPARPAREEGTAPGNVAIASFALVLGLATFVVRIWLPVGWTFAPLNFQFPHFPQYISLFILGTVASRRGWLSAISEDAARGRVWGRTVAVLIGVAPVLFVAGGALGGSTAPFRGGIHWQALVCALWEQLACVAMVISLLVWFRRCYDYQGKLARAISASAYAVYIIHAPILVFVALALQGLELHALLKFALAALISIPLCLVAGGIAKRPPIAAVIL